MKNTFTLLLFIVFSTLCSQAQTKDEQAVAAAVESLRKAMVDGDKSALEKLTGEELSYGHSNGNMEDKAAYINAIVSGKNDFKTIELSEQTIKLADNVAIVRHKFVADLMNNGSPATANIGVLMIWQKQRGQWKLIARQAFRL